MSMVIIVSAGMNEIISAGGGDSNGPFFPIKYFLPIYDPLIDSAIHTAKGGGLVTAALGFSATSLDNDTTGIQHSGQYIFNTTGYTISDDLKLLAWTGVGSTQGYAGANQITGSPFSSLTEINQLGGIPIAECFSGSAVPTTPSFGTWNLTNAATYYAKNQDYSSYLSDKSKYFKISSYSPIGIPDSNVMRGLFKCRLSNSVGNFKFNKIALYTTAFEVGIEKSQAPVLVAMCGLRDTIYKTTDGKNITNVEIDVECEFKINNSQSNLVYMSNDYWTRVNNNTAGLGGVSGVGLYYNGDVAIGTSGASAWDAHAKLELTDYDKAQLRLNGDYAVGFNDFQTDATGKLAVTYNGISGVSNEMFSGTVKFCGEKTIINAGSVYLSDLVTGKKYPTVIGNSIEVSGGRYNTTMPQLGPSVLAGQQITVDSKTATNTYGENISVLFRPNENGDSEGGYFGTAYGLNISVSANATVQTGQKLYGLYVTLPVNPTITSETSKYCAAYFGNGYVSFNDTVFVNDDMYVKRSLFMDGVTGVVYFTNGGSLASLVPVRDTSELGYVRLSLFDALNYIQCDGNVLSVVSPLEITFDSETLTVNSLVTFNNSVTFNGQVTTVGALNTAGGTITNSAYALGWYLSSQSISQAGTKPLVSIPNYNSDGDLAIDESGLVTIAKSGTYKATVSFSCYDTFAQGTGYAAISVSAALNGSYFSEIAYTHPWVHIMSSYFLNDGHQITAVCTFQATRDDEFNIIIQPNYTTSTFKIRNYQIVVEKLYSLH